MLLIRASINHLGIKSASSRMRIRLCRVDTIVSETGEHKTRMIAQIRWHSCACVLLLISGIYGRVVKRVNADMLTPRTVYLHKHILLSRTSLLSLILNDKLLIHGNNIISILLNNNISIYNLHILHNSCVAYTTFVNLNINVIILLTAK